MKALAKTNVFRKKEVDEKCVDDLTRHRRRNVGMKNKRSWARMAVGKWGVGKGKNGDRLVESRTAG
jgi:hypothetical protein